MRAYRYSDEELIDKLRSLYQRHGYLSGLIIDEAEGMPSSAAYAYRFGGLIRAYQIVGFTPDRDYQYLEINQFCAAGTRRCQRTEHRISKSAAKWCAIQPRTC